MAAYVVLGHPISDQYKKTFGCKRPVVFFPTSNGWKSYSNVAAWRNEYVFSESWKEITRWIERDMFRIQIFSLQEWREYHISQKKSIPNWSDHLKESSYYRSTGLDLNEELERLFALLPNSKQLEEQSECDEPEEP